MTTVEGVSAIRQRILAIGLNGQGGYDWTALAALKSHVSLREALEIEALVCMAGDRRHDFQEWYPTWHAEQRKKGSDLSHVGQLDPARLLEEMKMTRQAIEEHETLIAEHRIAIVTGAPSPLAAEDVDAVHGVIASLRANLPMIEAEYERIMSGENGGD